MDQYYKPKNKNERQIRRHIWERYSAMRDDVLRKEAELDWVQGDKEFMQWIPPRDDGDWRSNLVLPDSFAGISAYSQETIGDRSRPNLSSVENSDLATEMFCNSIITYSMDRTGYDYQQYLAKQAAAIRGTSFMMELYRLEKRDIQDPIGVDKNGNLTYVKKEIIDTDDTFSTFIENEYIFIDPAARHIDDARDMVHREIQDWDEFQRVYKKRGDFTNVTMVPKAGVINQQITTFNGNNIYFRKPIDITDNDVEILHYYNRATDEYNVLANNVVIRMGPIPYKHKELPVSVFTHYNVPGRIWGMGIPKVIYCLTEERKSLRNLALDRQNLQVNKLFLVNDLVDLDDEDFRTRPNGFIPVNTNGLTLDNVIKPVEYGDLPQSYYQAENMLLDDIRRASGINEQLEAISNSGTATQAAQTQQAAQRRIALINTLQEMDSITRIGRLKWSNIQFFYPAPRVEKITEDDNEREKKIYRQIKTDGMEFTVVKNEGNLELQMSDIDGSSGFKLDKTMARFMDGDFDVMVKAEASPAISKPIRQAKITEMFNLLALNPQLMSVIDPKKAVKRYLMINDERPTDWMTGSGMTDVDWKRLAMHENEVMAMGQPLAPTQDAPTVHTEEHLNYMNSKDYADLTAQNPAIAAIFQEHTFGENENNPQTQSVTQMGGQSGAPGLPGQPQGGTPPQIQPNDMTPSTMGGQDRHEAQKDAVSGL